MIFFIAISKHTNIYKKQIRQENNHDSTRDTDNN